MTQSGVADYRANLRGSVWMIVAMATFAIEDAFVKTTAGSLPVSQILILFGLGGALVFASAAVVRGEHLFDPGVLSRPMRFRVCFEVLGRLFYVLAIALAPLSTVTVILQATPIVVVAGAALFLGESVGWRRWTAIVVGLVGVMIIIRPGFESFSTLSLLAVIGMLGFAGRDLASRAAPASLSTTLLGFYGFVAVVMAGSLFSFWEAAPFVWPDTMTSCLLLGAILSGVVAYAALMKAMRTGEVSAVTPLRYTRLLFGVALGVLLFDESLDSPTLAGCVLIVSSGLFILWRSISPPTSRSPA